MSDIVDRLNAMELEYNGDLCSEAADEILALRESIQSAQMTYAFVGYKVGYKDACNGVKKSDPRVIYSAARDVVLAKRGG